MTALNSNKKNTLGLDHIPANRALIDQLFSHGQITRQARDEALKILIPHNHWGLWVARLLLGLGVCFVLSGIVYFFAFNWAKMPPHFKLGLIEFGLITSLISAYFCSLSKLSGQLSLLSASVLVGVFLAVFGQIYQTGADAYQLFMMWALLTLGWTIISNFATHWIFWLSITNIFIVLWWDQAVLPERENEPFILVLMILFNTTALVGREYCAPKPKFHWLNFGWTRWVLLVASLILMLAPMLILIVEPDEANTSLLLGALLGAIGHVAIYFYYRTRIKDMWSLAAVVISTSILIEVVVIKSISEILNREEAAMFLMMGLMTIGVVTGLTLFLRRLTEQLEIENA
ncbi:DUF2157 domain-containing protein [Kiloniella antarctica]|uniref:DUF2157 domain-containing protein n=1 Tax=Kiloniella antarctica TaxID=1550907 RepID=A0ABW5BJN3_9PROT